MTAHQLILGRALSIGAGLAAALLFVAPARSAPGHLRDEESCLVALRNAKKSEQEGKLQGAKDHLLSCAQAPCSSFVRQQCATSYNKLEADTPTIVLLATDASGAPRSDIQVRVDGTLVASQLDGRAFPLDPGLHDFSFSTNGHVFSTQKIMILQGQRNRFISVVVGGRNGGRGDDSNLAQPEPEVVERPAAAARRKATATRPTTATAKPTSAATTAAATPDATEEAPVEPIEAAPHAAIRHPRLPLVLGGVGLVSIGAGALLTSWGRKDNDRLAQCAPTCPAASVSHIRRLYLESNVAFGVGVAALGAAYWVYAVTHSGAAETSASETALHFGATPTSSGAFISASGGF